MTVAEASYCKVRQRVNLHNEGENGLKDGQLLSSVLSVQFKVRAWPRAWPWTWATTWTTSQSRCARRPRGQVTPREREGTVKPLGWVYRLSGRTALELARTIKWTALANHCMILENEPRRADWVVLLSGRQNFSVSMSLTAVRNS